MIKNINLAVLIDADNAQASIVKELLGEVSTYGTATVKRAYGDWTTTNLRSWKELLHAMAIQPVQQFAYTVGKNATDSSLIIDAMDLLHGGRVDGFCLVSSDSDFTRLATRIRESGLAVYGFGEKKTPAAFVAACDKFIYTEILRPAGACLDGPVTTEVSHQHAVVSMGADEDAFRKAIVAATRDDGFAPLGQVGNLILKNMPAFDSRNYGCGKLSELVRRLPFVEVKEIPVENSPHVALYVRLK